MATTIAATCAPPLLLPSLFGRCGRPYAMTAFWVLSIPTAEFLRIYTEYLIKHETTHRSAVPQNDEHQAAPTRPINDSVPLCQDGRASTLRASWAQIFRRQGDRIYATTNTIMRPTMACTHITRNHRKGNRIHLPHMVRSGNNTGANFIRRNTTTT